MPAGIGAVFCGQDWIEPVGDADQLRRAVAVKHPRGVGGVADFDAARERAHLAAWYIFQREDRADLDVDRRLAAVEGKPSAPWSARRPRR